MKHNIINTCMLFTAFFFTGSLYADQKLSPLEQKLNLITITVNKLCKAPSKEKSSYYKISANGKVGLNIKFTDLKTKVFFTKEEWKGFQRVLRKDQASDNKNYRDCSSKLSYMLIGKILPPKVKQQEGTTVYHQSTSGDKSPIINSENGTFNFN